MIFFSFFLMNFLFFSILEKDFLKGVFFSFLFHLKKRDIIIVRKILKKSKIWAIEYFIYDNHYRGATRTPPGKMATRKPPSATGRGGILVINFPGGF